MSDFTGNTCETCKHLFARVQQLERELAEARDCIKSVVSEWHDSTRQRPGDIIRHAEDLFARLRRKVFSL